MGEQPYLDLLRRVLEEGEMREGRNGNTKSVFGASMRFSLQEGTLPLLTTKKVAWKTCLRELLWFIRGSTDNRDLTEQKVNIWTAHETPDSSDLGPIYGHQWRHFNAEYTGSGTDYEGKGVDQLQSIIRMLQDPTQRSSRRMVMSAWNPCQIPHMALPPCHVLCQFYVSQGTRLSCAVYQRSGDIGLGVPFNIASYSFLTHMLAHHCGLVAHELVHFLGDVHAYEDHLEPLALQLQREPYTFPTVTLQYRRESIEAYTVDDVKVEGYRFHDPIRMEMHA